MWTRFLAVTCLAAGCAAPPPPQAAAPGLAAPVAQASPVLASAGPVDGVYRGTASLQKVAGKHVCAAPSGEVSTTIRNGVLTRRWNGAVLQATVQPDGSFQAAGGRGLLSGRVRGGTLEFDMVGEGCSFHYAMTRVPRAG